MSALNFINTKTGQSFLFAFALCAKVRSTILLLYPDETGGVVASERGFAKDGVAMLGLQLWSAGEYP